MVTQSRLSEHLGGDVSATFEVARATDTEDVRADPESVSFGRCHQGPIVKLNYNKYNAFLPPWQQLVSFTLEGDNTAVFTMPEYNDTYITGKLKTVEVISPAVSLQ